VPSFVVAKNPEKESSLRYLLQIPIDGGLLLKAKERWPEATRSYCHPFEGEWPSHAKILEDVRVISCEWRESEAIELVLDRPKKSRSEFIFTQMRGRSAIFWQALKDSSRVAKRRKKGSGAPTLEEIMEARFSGTSGPMDRTRNRALRRTFWLARRARSPDRAHAGPLSGLRGRPVSRGPARNLAPHSKNPTVLLGLSFR
jgi:hypothetical protein